MQKKESYTNLERHEESISDDVNPFRCPLHYNNLFQMMNKERSQKKLEHQRKMALPIHEKVTHTRRMTQSRLMEEVKERESNTDVSRTPQQGNPSRRIYMLKDLNIDKGSMKEYIMKKRELFLMEYSLTVKRGEIQLLEQKAIEEERKLTRAEKFLEENTILFEDFLKENDKNSVEAINIAEQETKVKLEKIAEIKKFTSKIVAVKSDIAKYEDMLNEYKKYEEFLLMLSQSERCKSTSSGDMQAMSDGKHTEKIKKMSTPSHRSGGSRVIRELSSSRETSSRNKSSRLSIKTPALETDSSDGEEPELFFTDPQELLNVMAELEEQTLSLIQNTRDTEESLEDFKQTAELTQKKIESESKQLKEQTDVMMDTIQQETEKTAQLEQRCQLFGFGKNKPDDQDNTLELLSGKVEEVFRCCVGETSANLSILQMLTTIEGKLVELLENAEMIPRECMSIAERAQEKERRIRLRDEKIRLQMMHQEERQRKAMERSKADKTNIKKIK
ncbi:cilia- and flagella-associated protein 100 isoform X2 [Triplophysa dalaica]|uniref:cilia- and flagella-associated protein 100 isoform X2 n=1 Tax=Triplophysa dalaica TaxID=1582913 RepID=UPI0024DF99B4|nr:cilia- and flagella-associated protein 100 isoform X2 [Triplophysa dalaica]